MKIAPTDLDHSQRRVFEYLALDKDAPLAFMPSVGPKSIEKLIALGLVEIAPRSSLQGSHYRLTKTGNDMRGELARRMLIPRY